MRMTSILPASLSAIGILALTACAVGPDYQRPIIPLPAHYNAAVEASSAPVRADWWAYFNDATLSALIDTSLTNNADLAVAAARVREAGGVVKESNAVFFPQIDADIAGTRQQSSGKNQLALASGASGATYSNRRATLSTSYEIDVWGKLRRGKEAADALAVASAYARDSIRLSLAAMVSNAYLALRSLDAQVSTVNQTVESRQETLRLASIRVKAGLSSPLEALQAETALASAQAQVATLRQQRATTETLLGLLSGNSGLKIAPDTLEKLPLPPVPPAGLPSDLLAARPDVRQAEATLIAANARIGVAKAAYFPKLSLTGLLGSESRELEDLFRDGAGIWSGGLGLNLPLFDFGRTSGRVEQASAQQQQAVGSYRKTVENAFKEASDALIGLRETGEAETAQATRRGAARKALDIAQKRYAAGAIAYLELLDTQRSANDAELAWLATRQNRLAASVDLFKALGGGWKP